MKTSLHSSLSGDCRPRWRRWTAGAVMFALPVFAGGCLRLESDMQSLRDAAMETLAPEGEWDEQIEISVGACTLGLARGVTALAGVDEQARQVLRCARSAQVGVYVLQGVGAPAAPAAFFERTSSAMGQRGWERVVATVDGGDTVAVFVPRDLDPEDSLQVGVVVFDGNELVVASARADVEPLVALAMAEHRKRGLLPAMADE